MLVYLQPIASSTTKSQPAAMRQQQHQERKAAAHCSTENLAILGVIPHARYHRKPVGNANEEGGQPMPEQNESPFSLMLSSFSFSFLLIKSFVCHTGI